MPYAPETGRLFGSHDEEALQVMVPPLGGHHWSFDEGGGEGGFQELFRRGLGEHAFLTQEQADRDTGVASGMAALSRPMDLGMSSW